MQPIATDGVCRLSVLNHTKTAEPIEILFGDVDLGGPRNYVLHVGPDLPTGGGTFEGCDIGIFPHATEYCSQLP